MLELKVYDGTREVRLEFEHSLLSVSKWESKHEKAFLASQQKLPTEMIDYFCDMLLTPDESTDLVYVLQPDQLDQLAKYINQKQTASSVPVESLPKGAKEIVTSELIYYWLTVLQIPFHPVETWHINRLMMLVQITNYKQQPAKKVNPVEQIAKWKAANAKRKAETGSNG